MTRAGAFLFVTRCLAGKIRKLPRSADWPRVVGIASEHWMTLALYREFKEKGLLIALPADLVEYFSFLHEANDFRNRAILEQVADIAVVLNEIGVEPLLLKGAANLASGLYDDPTVRLLYDIDIVVPGELALACWQRLISAGYRNARPEERPEDLPDCEWPPLVREGGVAELEVHRIVEWHHLLGSAALYAATEQATLPRGKARILDPTSRMIYTLAHAFVHHRERFQAKAHLRDLYDATLLLRRYGAEIDWARLLDAFESAGERNALRQALFMWRRMFGLNPPCAVRSSPATWLYLPLCLLEVSKPQIAPLCEMLLRNIRLRELRQSFRRPSVGLRKIRFAAKIWTSAPANK